jgi:hypothetical protein
LRSEKDHTVLLNTTFVRDEILIITKNINEQMGTLGILALAVVNSLLTIEYITTNVHSGIYFNKIRQQV